VPGSGAFAESDPSEAVELIDRKLLRGGLRVFRRVDGVVDPPGAGGARRPRPQGAHGCPASRAARVDRSSPLVPADRDRPRLGCQRRHGGRDARGCGRGRAGGARGRGRVVHVPLPEGRLRRRGRALHALGAEPAGGRWEYHQTVEVDTTGPAGP